MIKDFSGILMQKVVDLFKRLDKSVTIKNRKEYAQVKSQLYIIIDDLTELVESLNERLDKKRYLQ